MNSAHPDAVTEDAKKMHLVVCLADMTAGRTESCTVFGVCPPVSFSKDYGRCIVEVFHQSHTLL